MMTNIYFNEKTKEYYGHGEFCCNHCKKLIKEIMFYCVSWRFRIIKVDENNRKKVVIPHFASYCFSCKEKALLIGHIGQQFWCILDEFISEDFIPVFFSYPTLKTRYSDCFSVEEIRNTDAEIIDHTHLAGRIDHIAIAQIEKNQKLLAQQIEELDNPVQDIDQFFAQIKASNLIEKKEIKLIFGEN